MERKLAEFRAKRQREELFDNIKIKVHNAFLFLYRNRVTHGTKKVTEDPIPGKATPKDAKPSSRDHCSDVVNQISSSSSSDSSTSKVEESTGEIDQETFLSRHVINILFFLLWCTLFAITVELQFGLVFLVTSTICMLYYNTRTRPRQPGELSAYSVFNPNCEAIDGTLNAEQFEREIRYGSAGVSVKQ